MSWDVLLLALQPLLSCCPPYNYYISLGAKIRKVLGLAKRFNDYWKLGQYCAEILICHTEGLARRPVGESQSTEITEIYEQRVQRREGMSYRNHGNHGKHRNIRAASEETRGNVTRKAQKARKMLGRHSVGRFKSPTENVNLKQPILSRMTVARFLPFTISTVP